MTQIQHPEAIKTPLCIYLLNNKGNLDIKHLCTREGVFRVEKHRNESTERSHVKPSTIASEHSNSIRQIRDNHPTSNIICPLQG